METTAKDIFDMAAMLMFAEDEGDMADYEVFFFPALQLCINENFTDNNTLRAMRGKEPLPEPPKVSAMTDIVDYEPEYTGRILAKGVAGYIFMDDEKGIATEYRANYEYERAAPKLAVWED